MDDDHFDCLKRLSKKQLTLTDDKIFSQKTLTLSDDRLEFRGLLGSSSKAIFAHKEIKDLVFLVTTTPFSSIIK
jgi:hypothetical protein